MAPLPFRNMFPWVCLLLLVLPLAGCTDESSLKIIRVSLKNTETYEYVMHVGDEEGAMISTQASHYTISEIRHDASTSWAAVFVYQPATGYVGSDVAAIKIFTGSDGAGPNTRTKTVIFDFEIIN